MTDKSPDNPYEGLDSPSGVYPHAAGLWEVFERAIGDDGPDPRCIALAKTKLEEAMLWYDKAVPAVRKIGEREEK